MRKAKRHLVSFREIIQDSRDWSLEHGFGGAYRLGSQVRNMTGISINKQVHLMVRYNIFMKYRQPNFVA